MLDRGQVQTQGEHLLRPAFQGFDVLALRRITADRAQTRTSKFEIWIFPPEAEHYDIRQSWLLPALHGRLCQVDVPSALHHSRISPAGECPLPAYGNNIGVGLLRTRSTG